ncbi:hypothetical protein CSC70_04375 [Pseudoxanthomonas kalamensis DSM 18571]|uniref:alpha/beta hydrolase n=1 Tax=Pseudoxanthomonas kalamensis TaxID=289483 RepID=UPI0013918E39|nr:alpha/beta fold hydrolase [Pseudoxanthomonas kalamensis]KAF1711163.1 hypothetical protein CSC70_04375 [Pseudoxanthomonas kalamensis DSM 18571]
MLHVLLIHGAGGGGWEWNVWRRVLQAHGMTAHAPDVQPAATGLAKTSLQDYAGQVRDALRALPRPRVAVGASLGGLLVLRNADAADALVLVNPLPPAPWHARLPAREWPEIVPWQVQARLASTGKAMPDAYAVNVLYAHRHWCDESGLALSQAHAGVEIAQPACPLLLVLSAQDDDVPPSAGRELAAAWRASVIETAATSHVGPLFGRDAAFAAEQAALWLRGLRLDR